MIKYQDNNVIYANNYMILLTGATGFLGSHLLKKLDKEKIKYQALVRNKNFKNRNFIYGNLLNEESLKKIRDPIDTVIHLAAVIDEEDKNLFRVNVDGTKKLIDLAEKLKVKKFIFLSSALVNFKDIDTPYVRSKKEGEKIVRSSNLPWIILRPTQMYGSGDKRNFGWIFSFIKKSPIVPIFFGDLFLQPVYVGDIVDAILSCLDNKISEKKIYNLGGPELLKLGEIEELIIKKINKPKIKICLPDTFLKILLNIKDFSPSFLRKKLTVLSKFKKISFIEYKKAEDELGFKPINFRKGLDSIVKF